MSRVHGYSLASSFTYGETLQGSAHVIPVDIHNSSMIETLNFLSLIDFLIIFHQLSQGHDKGQGGFPPCGLPPVILNEKLAEFLYFSQFFCFLSINEFTIFPSMYRKNSPIFLDMYRQLHPIPSNRTIRCIENFLNFIRCVKKLFEFHLLHRTKF